MVNGWLMDGIYGIYIWYIISVWCFGTMEFYDVPFNWEQ